MSYAETGRRQLQRWVCGRAWKIKLHLALLPIEGREHRIPKLPKGSFPRSMTIDFCCRMLVELADCCVKRTDGA